MLTPPADVVAGDALLPSRSTITALTVSPHKLSGMPTTQTSCTSCRVRRWKMDPMLPPA
jgi:hypothetical protein